MPVLPLLSLLMPVIGKVLDKVLPDPEAKALAEREMLLALTAMSTQVDLGQLEVNKVEAANPRLFVAGWRPFIGWVCGIAVAWEFVGSHILSYLISVAGFTPPAVPNLDTNALIALLSAMLGIGGLRTFEKIQGVAAK